MFSKFFGLEDNKKKDGNDENFFLKLLNLDDEETEQVKSGFWGVDDFSEEELEEDDYYFDDDEEI